MSKPRQGEPAKSEWAPEPRPKGGVRDAAAAFAVTMLAIALLVFLISKIV